MDFFFLFKDNKQVTIDVKIIIKVELNKNSTFRNQKLAHET
jgi:hypothetical protein